jgi:hypothetical protein
MPDSHILDTSTGDHGTSEEVQLDYKVLLFARVEFHMAIPEDFSVHGAFVLLIFCYSQTMVEMDT